MGILDLGFLRHARSGSAGTRCALGPQRPRRREQKSLSESHVIVEQIDHGALALDPFRDQVDAKSAEQIGKVGRVNVGCRGLPLIEQQRSRHLDIADAAVGQFARLDPEIGDVVDREPEAALGQGREMFDFDRTQLAECRLLEFEHERGRQRPIGVKEIEALCEGGRIAERRRGDVAENSDLLVAHHQPAQHLDATQHHHVIDPADQPAGFGDADEIVGGEDLVPVVAQPGHRFVEAHLALRQAHHRLQIDVDPVLLDGIFHRGKNLRLAAGELGFADDVR